MKLLLLSLATCFWGLGFVGTRWTFESYDAMWSHGLRYLIAGVLAAFLLAIRLPLKEAFRIKKETLLCGILLWTGLQLQTVGIGLTTLAKSGFISTFYAIFTPIIGILFLGEKYRKTYWFLVAMALLGVAFLCGLEVSGLNLGDLYTIASALFFSIHILAVDKFAQHEDSLNFNFQQCIIMGILGFVASTLISGLPDLSPLLSMQAFVFPSALYGFIVLSILSSLIAFSIQVYAQKGTPAHIVSLIFLLESVFSTIFGYLFFQESLDQNGFIGCALILISVALIPKFARIKKRPDEL